MVKIATNKCAAHRISAKSHLSSNNCPYSLCDMTLQWSIANRDLGVTMDNQLVFDQHVANIVHTASTRVFLILKCFLSRDRGILVKAFVTYVRPILEYCSPVWFPGADLRQKAWSATSPEGPPPLPFLLLPSLLSPPLPFPPLFPSPAFPLPPLSSFSLPLSPPFPLRSRTPLIQLEGLGAL